ncbi:helix-turn-helix transcriptional regulator [Streptomyces sp. RFCAC02]|uniref:helix-turn-helix domain-containing protein n=1 Tax=Streptomyces sp. RFCAC02 TaxID=2499143 RepID=UPI00101EF36E|nr:helix-turn-helix transcriptional regulator [Streptomyces sp. RFCAC02]
MIDFSALRTDKGEISALQEVPERDDFSEPPQRPTAVERLGANVRRVRVGRRMTQKGLSSATGYSESYISQVESGQLVPSLKFVQGCDTAFETHGLFADLLKQLEEGDAPSWFLPYLQLERRASRILDYSPNLIMGVLQTEAYARAVFEAAHPREEPQVIDGKVEARLRRRVVFQRAKPPELWVILHEGCLRTVVGGPTVMAEQLAYLLEASISPWIDLQVLPFSAGVVAEHLMPYTLLALSDRPAVMYSDGPRGGRVYDSAETVAWSFDNYDRLRANALSLNRSRSLIESLLKELHDAR